MRSVGALHVAALLALAFSGVLSASALKWSGRGLPLAVENIVTGAASVGTSGARVIASWERERQTRVTQEELSRLERETREVLEEWDKRVLQGANVSQLRRMAARAKIRGRSAMKKDELLAALSISLEASRLYLSSKFEYR